MMDMNILDDISQSYNNNNNSENYNSDKNIKNENCNNIVENEDIIVVNINKSNNTNYK